MTRVFKFITSKVLLNRYAFFITTSSRRNFCMNYTSESFEKSHQDKKIKNAVQIMIENKSLEIKKKLEGTIHYSQVTEMQIQKLYTSLYDNGVSLEKIDGQFVETPDLLKYSSHKMNALFRFFREAGFESDVTWKNIVLCPDLMNLSPKKLEDSFNLYAEYAIGDICPLVKLINKYPTLYLAQPSMVIQNVDKLTAIFPPAETVNVIRNAPLTLVIPFEKTHEKIVYINETLGVDQEHISQCTALDKPFTFIKTRLEFLKRSGLLFKHKMEKDRSTYKLGPKVNEIFDTSQKEFINKVAKCTKDEFETFKKLLEEEEYLDEGESESDSDSDDEGYLDEDDYDKVHNVIFKSSKKSKTKFGS